MEDFEWVDVKGASAAESPAVLAPEAQRLLHGPVEEAEQHQVAVGALAQRVGRNIGSVHRRSPQVPWV